ncbi:hypothetical protein ACP275_05G081300 [Erythranthe tilingii]
MKENKGSAISEPASSPSPLAIDSVYINHGGADEIPSPLVIDSLFRSPILSLQDTVGVGWRCVDASAALLQISKMGLCSEVTFLANLQSYIYLHVSGKIGSISGGG